jgi:hypothetical protein
MNEGTNDAKWDQVVSARRQVLVFLRYARTFLPPTQLRTTFYYASLLHTVFVVRYDNVRTTGLRQH